MVARVVGLLLRSQRARSRASAVAHSFAYAFEVGDGDEAAGAVQRVAGDVPLGVVFAVDDVQKVALGEGEVAGVGAGVGGCVVVKSFNNLAGNRG